MKKIEYQDFNVETVSLNGVKLIEASAGTGKTYSIAILVLRALLEAEFLIPQLLIMTFTNDAVAELQERVSKFLYIALNIIGGDQNADKMIERLVQNAVNIKGVDAVKEIITNNILLLDEANILTIHGFCQKILGAFPMDTQQPFSNTLLTQTETIVTEQIQLFWRNYITTAPVSLQGNFDEKFYSIITDLVNHSLGDKPLYNMDLEKTYSFPTMNEDTPWDETLKFEILCFAIQEITLKINQFYTDNNLLTFDNLIANLHKAVARDSQNILSQKIAEKLPIVFIDEFQDTDKMQYDIFKHIFEPFAKCLFYIGDPKQSIYAFRKADLYTYFKARESADEVFSMNTNYRSNPSFLKAVNSFFQPVPDTNAFGFDDGAEAINYIPVKYPEQQSTFWQLYKTNNPKPTEDLWVKICKNADVASNELVSIIQNFLAAESEYYLQNQNGVKRHINPSDLAILVKSNSDGNTLANELSKLGIKTVSYQSTKIQKSAEMNALLHVLEAMSAPSLGNIYKVLLGNILNFKFEDLSKLNLEEAVYTFKELYETWMRSGVIAAIETFINTFGLYEKLPATPNGDRILANLIQISEILNKQEKQMNNDATALLEWFQYNINNEKSISFEAEQRIESDEDAIRILTVHKSKGLEFNIVFCYKLDGNKTPNNKQNVISFRDNQNGVYYSIERQTYSDDDKIKQLIITDIDQENLRLLYVAITRAKLNCLLFCTDNFNSKLANKSINRFIKNKDFFEENIVVQLPKEINTQKVKRVKLNTQNATNITQAYKPLPYLKIKDLHWHRISYSGLSNHESFFDKPRNYDLELDYDKFIYNLLPSGTLTGLFLHEILEKIDFQNEQSWNYQIDKMMRKYYTDKLENEDFKLFIFKMLQHVTQAIISINNQSFQLTDVNKQQRLAELQFDFPLDAFKVSQINQYYNEDERAIFADYNDTAQIEGIMNGFIDLLFEYNGQFFILDWKSNYLGYLPEHYNQLAVKLAMDEQNYHLQYMIYCVAANLYLSSRITHFNFDKQFGGVAYFFLRGVRQNQTSGIYTYKPTWSEVSALTNLLTEKNELITQNT